MRGHLWISSARRALILALKGKRRVTLQYRSCVWSQDVWCLLKSWTVPILALAWRSEERLGCEIMECFLGGSYRYNSKHTLSGHPSGWGFIWERTSRRPKVAGRNCKDLSQHCWQSILASFALYYLNRYFIPYNLVLHTIQFCLINY